MWISLFLFIFSLFMYVHLQSEYKYHSDIQVYECDYISNKEFIGTCQLKQPFITNLKMNSPSHLVLERYPDIQYRIKDTNDYSTNYDATIDTVKLNYNQSKILFDTDKQSHFYTCRNLENNIIEQYKVQWDSFIKPPNTINSNYDIMFGSKNSKTPSLYHNSSSKFIFIQGNHVKVQLCSFNSIPSHEISNDYENYEFWSKYNVNDYVVECFVYVDQVLFIPPYCFYNIQFLDPNTVVCSAEYNTFLNLIAHSKQNCMYLMKNQNTFINSLKPFSNSHLDASNYHSSNITIDELDLSFNSQSIIEKTSEEFIKQLKNK